MQFVHCKGLTKYTVHTNCAVQSMCKIQTKFHLKKLLSVFCTSMEPRNLHKQFIFCKSIKLSNLRDLYDDGVCILRSYCK